MTDNEPPDELSAGATSPLRWPDPTRPIISERWQTGRSGYDQGYGSPPPAGAPTPEADYRNWPPPVPSAPPRRRLRLVIIIALMFLMALLVNVWLWWWR